MEEKKTSKISLSTPFLIITIIIIILLSAFIYKLYNEKIVETERTAELKAKVNTLNETVNDLQKKVSSVSETTNSNDSAKSTNNLNINYNVNYDKISSIKGFIEFQEGDNVTGQVNFENDGKVFIWQNVVYGLSGTYTISGNTITCNLTSIEGEDQKTQCNYVVKYKILHSNALEVISSNLDDIYNIGELLINYTKI